jgi:hypothetical protein
VSEWAHSLALEREETSRLDAPAIQTDTTKQNLRVSGQGALVLACAVVAEQQIHSTQRDIMKVIANYALDRIARL